MAVHTRRSESRIFPVLVVVALVTLIAVLPDRYTALPYWSSFVFGGALIAAMLLAGAAGLGSPWTKVERYTTYVLVAIVLLQELIILKRLRATSSSIRCSSEPSRCWRRRSGSGPAMWSCSPSSSGSSIAAGLSGRASGWRGWADFSFARGDESDGMPVDWQPTFVDYLFLAFTTSTAFSPTDTLPLTGRAKMLMLLGALDRPRHALDRRGARDQYVGVVGAASMQAMKALPSPEDARQARDRIAGFVRRTPSIESGGTVYKLEFLQVTGSFKPRGAFNLALQLDAATLARGLVAVSGGNHGLAVAHVGARLKAPTTVIMPRTTPAWVVDRAQADGAEVILTPNIAEAFDEAQQRAAAGQTLIHPFDDERIMAGQGTLGLELLEDIPQLATLVMSIGGGGMVAGVASVIKALKPDVKIYGVETRGADAMRQALDAGHIVTLPAITSIARTLGAPYVSDATLHAAQTLLEDVVVVSDADAVRSIVELQQELHVTVEPASACCHAALRAGLVPRASGGATAVVLCGGNVTLDEIAAWRHDLLG